jgi:hypothetical protein
MLLRLMALSGGLVLLSSAVAAAPSPVEKAFKGTIVSTYPDGRIARLWMKPDGSYTSEGRRHDRHSGHWKLSGDRVCFKRGLFGYCTAIPTESAFTAKAVTGETIQVKLAPGREGEKAG